MHRLALLVVFTGCYSPSIGVGGACSELGECPAGQHCYGGRCLTAPPVDDADVLGDVPELDAPDGSTIDAGPDAAIDAPLDAFVSPTWLTPTPIPGVNTAASESDPCMSPNQLTIVFQRSSDLYIGTRASTGVAFTVSPLTALNSTSEEASPELTANGTVIYFTSDRVTAGLGEVYKSTLSAGTWSAPALVTALNDVAADDGDLAISPDGLTAFVVRNNVLLKSTRPTTGSAWGTPAATGTSWGSGAAAPSINAAGDVYLHANTPRDLFVSRRAGSNYPTPTAISELNSAATRDAAPYVSADDLFLWFEQDGDLFETHR